MLLKVFDPATGQWKIEPYALVLPDWSGCADDPLWVAYMAS